MGYASLSSIAVCCVLAPVVQAMMDTKLFDSRINFHEETTMSQKAQQNPDPKHAPTSEHKRQDTPIIGASPDDPIGVKPDGTSQPGQPHK